MEDNIRTYQLAKVNKAPEVSIKSNSKIHISKELIWEKPETWTSSTGSSMRIASFSVPYLDEFGDLSVIKLGGNGGGLESNINRWRRQLSLEPMSLVKIEKELAKREGGFGIYRMLQIINKNIDSAFLCAIIPMEDYTIFVKLALKPKGISLVEKDFITFCSSLRNSN
tara:strand:- start:756 stop:1259 length:504 start_codon:yes stop_codon:yes gene_type:complete